VWTIFFWPVGTCNNDTGSAHTGLKRWEFLHQYNKLRSFPCGKVLAWFHSVPTSALEAGAARAPTDLLRAKSPRNPYDRRLGELSVCSGQGSKCPSEYKLQASLLQPIGSDRSRYLLTILTQFPRFLCLTSLATIRFPSNLHHRTKVSLLKHEPLIAVSSAFRHQLLSALHDATSSQCNTNFIPYRDCSRRLLYKWGEK